MSETVINKNIIKNIIVGFCTLTTLSFGLPVAADETATVASNAYSISRGGRLYDKWFKESKQAKAPKVANPNYPDTGKYKGKKAADWRCKECHGWDYKGNQGAYANGKHFTGIKGVQAMAGAAPERIVAILKDDTHVLTSTGLTDNDYHDLAMFVSQGQITSASFIDSKTKAVKGDSVAGQNYYETVCANCHGLDGKEDDLMPPLGKLANDNPWEVLHKIVNGQPDAEFQSGQI